MEKETEEEAPAKVAEQIASMTISADADTEMLNQQGCAGATSDPGLEEVIFIF